jgi:hypothetical protein
MSCSLIIIHRIKTDGASFRSVLYVKHTWTMDNVQHISVWVVIYVAYIWEVPSLNHGHLGWEFLWYHSFFQEPSRITGNRQFYSLPRSLFLILKSLFNTWLIIVKLLTSSTHLCRFVHFMRACARGCFMLNEVRGWLLMYKVWRRKQWWPVLKCQYPPTRRQSVTAEKTTFLNLDTLDLI